MIEFPARLIGEFYELAVLRHQGDMKLQRAIRRNEMVEMAILRGAGPIDVKKLQDSWKEEK